MEFKSLQIFLITVNVVVILILLYAIVNALRELNDTPVHTENLRTSHNCRKTITMRVPTQVSVGEAYRSILEDLTELINRHKNNPIAHQVFNEIIPTQCRIRRFLTEINQNIQK